MAGWQRQFGISGATDDLPVDSQGPPFELSVTRRRQGQSEGKAKGEEKALAAGALAEEAMTAVA